MYDLKVNINKIRIELQKMMPLSVCYSFKIIQ